MVTSFRAAIAACVHLPVTRELLDDTGLILDEDIRGRITGALTALVDEALGS